jgi:hypothetical protein
MNKRGSHIDVIISFIIFISFIVFTYAILQPTLTIKGGKTSVADNLEPILVNNLSGDLTIISLVTNQTSPNCIKLNNFFGNTNINPTIVVENSTGFVFTAYNSINDLYINTSSNPSNSLFYVYYSPEFNPIASNTLTCSIFSYTIGQISSSSQDILDSNVIQLINNYNNNYNTVKNWFNLSVTNNFGFSFTYQNQTVIKTNNTIPPFTNVYSGGFPVLYLTGNTSLQSGLLTIQVW